MPNPWNNNSSNSNSNSNSMNTSSNFQEGTARANETVSSTKLGQSAAEPTESTCSLSLSREIQKSSVLSPELQAVVNQYKISHYMAQHLFELRKVEIVLVCDDSGSMGTKIDGTNETRWDRLKKIVKVLLDIAVIFDQRGIDIYFLNRPRIRRVKTSDRVDQIFEEDPVGYTPLVPVLDKIFEFPATRKGYDKKLLVFIATDGAPTDDCGRTTVNQLEDLLRNRRNAERTYIQFLLCTDDPESIDYLAEWDRKMDNLDIIREFEEERREILRIGKMKEFTFGDYVVKALVGAMVPEIDSLDEP